MATIVRHIEKCRDSLIGCHKMVLSSGETLIIDGHVEDRHHTVAVVRVLPVAKWYSWIRLLNRWGQGIAHIDLHGDRLMIVMPEIHDHYMPDVLKLLGVEK